MATVRKIEQKIPTIRKKKRVAAYARISMVTEQMMHSLSAQVSHYSSLIQKNPEWEYAGVYADEGISGTSTSKRKGFQELLQDCEDGKIDIVLVKSISRFARNTVDLLETVRHLKDIGVEVRFERENISSFTGDGELMLTLLASFAQEESESLSRNEKWAIKKKFENGESHVPLRSFGYDWDPDTWCCVINEEEAKWVRYIYKRFLSGASVKAIAKEMRENGVKAVRGEPLGRTTIRRILTSELYVGDVILQRYYTPAIGKPKLNNGEVPKYMVSDAHPAIVSREDYEAAKKLLAERAETADNYGYVPHLFAGLVKCGKCGSACNYVSIHRCPEKSNIECRLRKEKKCDLLPIREHELIEAVGDIKAVKQIVLFDERIEIAFKNGKAKTVCRDYPEGRYSCFSGKLVCAACEKTFIRMTSHKTRHIWTCNNRKIDKESCPVSSIPESELIEATESFLGDGNYKIQFYVKVEMVRVYEDRLDFIFRDGSVKTWQRK